MNKMKIKIKNPRQEAFDQLNSVEESWYIGKGE